MEYTYAPGIPTDDYPLIPQSPLFQGWLGSLDSLFHLSAVHFESADFVTRKGQKILLFLKIKATVTDEKGKRVPGIVMLRGNAVGVLVVLWCEGKPYLLLVDQPRLATGTRHSLEIVAGMLDWSSDWHKVALEELHEEAGLQVSDHELIDLQSEFGGQQTGVIVSCGLLDERLYLAAVEREVSRADLKNMDGKEQEYTAEEEGIHTVVLPYHDACRRFTDSKSMIAVYLYEKWREKHGKPLADA